MKPRNFAAVVNANYALASIVAVTTLPKGAVRFDTVHAHAVSQLETLVQQYGLRATVTNDHGDYRVVVGR